MIFKITTKKTPKKPKNLIISFTKRKHGKNFVDSLVHGQLNACSNSALWDIRIRLILILIYISLKIIFMVQPVKVNGG